MPLRLLRPQLLDRGDEPLDFVGRGVAGAADAQQSVGSVAEEFDDRRGVEIAVRDEHARASRDARAISLESWPRIVNETVGVRGWSGVGPYIVTPLIAESPLQSRSTCSCARACSPANACSSRLRRVVPARERREEIHGRRRADHSLVIQRSRLERGPGELSCAGSRRGTSSASMRSFLPNSTPVCGP